MNKKKKMNRIKYNLRDKRENNSTKRIFV